MSVSLSEGSQARPGVKGETIHEAVKSPQHRVFTLCHVQGCWCGVKSLGRAFNRFAGRLILSFFLY